MWKYSTVFPNFLTMQNGIVASTGVASSAQAAANSNATQIASLLANNNQNVSGGINLKYDFTVLATGVFDGTVWNTSGTDIGINNYAGGNYVENLYNIVQNTAGILYNVYGGSRRSYVLNKTVFMSDAQSVQVVLGSYGSETIPTTIFFHATTNLSVFTGMRIWDNKIQWGYGTYSAGVYSFTVWKTWNHPTHNGDLIELTNQGTTVQLKRNGSIVDTYVDVGGTMGMGSDYRSFGMIFESAVGDWQSDFYSTMITSLTATDIVIPTYLGTGWIFTRTSTGTKALSNGVEFPTGVFDTSAGNNCIINLSAGSITVVKEGWYLIHVGLDAYNFLGSNSYRINLYKNHVVYRRGIEMSGTNESSLAASWGEYFAVGDVITLGQLNYNSSSLTIDGTVDGARTYFTGILSNA